MYHLMLSSVTSKSFKKRRTSRRVMAQPSLTTRTMYPASPRAFSLTSSLWTALLR